LEVLRIRKIRIVILAACLPCLLTCSCKNISAQDFGPGDIVNILEVVFIDDEYMPEPSIDTGEEDDTAEPYIPGVTLPAETAEPESGAPATEPPEEEPPATEPTEPPGTAEPPDTDYATVINVRTVFSGAPEKFLDIPFPEAVRMTDSLKKNISGLADFSPRDFGGAAFYLTTTDAKLFTPLYSGGMLSDARRYRTELVDAECNITTISVEIPEDAIIDEIRTKVLAGEYASDIMCVPFRVQSELIKNGLLINLKKVPFLNLNAEYYNASATSAYTINGNVFGLVSDLTFEPADIYAVFYNKSLVKEYNLTNPAMEYKRGNWDYEGMYAVSKEFTAAAGIGGAGENSPLRAVGIDKESANLVGGLFLSSGGRYFTVRDYNYPLLNFNNEKTARFLDVVSKMFLPAEESGMENYFGAGAESQNEAFKNGGVLFSFAKLGLIPDITNSAFEWGLLPVPAMGAESAGYSFTDNGAMSISALRNARSTEACGIVISALSMVSHRQLKEIYVLEQMMYTLRDVDSVNALADIISDTAFSQFNAYSTVPEITGATGGVLRDAANGYSEFAAAYETSRRILNEFFSASATFART